MLKKATPADITAYGKVFYRIARTPALSAYPTYSDGIKTEADFLREAEASEKCDTSELLLFLANGSVEGWISYDWIPKDNYLQLTACNISHGTEQALTELLQQLWARFPGYTAYFGYPDENRSAIRFLRAHGFQCIESSLNHSFFFEGSQADDAPACVEQITARNFDRFRAVYHPDAQTYWNCDRILAAIDDWIIYVYTEHHMPTAAIFLTGKNGTYEIFGIEFADGKFHEDVCCALLTAALGACKRLHARYLIYFCKEEEKTVLHRLGFKYIGRYVLYTKTL